MKSIRPHPEAHVRVSAPTAEQDILFAAWRADALHRMPYFARLLFSLRVLDAPGLGTWAVDAGHRIYIDFEAVVDKGARWNVESLLHECSHLFAGHHAMAIEFKGQVPDFSHHVWGIAADAAINDDLVEAGCDTIAVDGVLPTKLRMSNGQTPHHYYRTLLRRHPQLRDHVATLFVGCGSGSGGTPWDGELSLDDTLEGIAPAVSASEVELLQVQTATAINEHNRRHPGTVAGGLLRRAAATLTPSRTPWQKLLAAQIRHGVQRGPGARDSDPATRSRRHHNATVMTSTGPRKYIVPGTSSPRPSVAVVRDTSGSMSFSQLAVATREVEAISKRLGIRGQDLRVLDVDASVAQARPFNRSHDFDDAYGGGGTDMRVGITAAAELRPPPSLIVVVTDGWTPWPRQPVGVPVIACLVGPDADHAEGSIPDFIKTVKVSE